MDTSTSTELMEVPILRISNLSNSFLSNISNSDPAWPDKWVRQVLDDLYQEVVGKLIETPCIYGYKHDDFSRKVPVYSQVPHLFTADDFFTVRVIPTPAADRRWWTGMYLVSLWNVSIADPDFRWDAYDCFVRGAAYRVSF